MLIFEQHEKFEMHVLNYMNSTRLLTPLVFGGGTMLRLCHELTRYSVDIDFYFSRKINTDTYYHELLKFFSKKYVIKDHQNKFNTLLIEIKHQDYPRKLKVEINKNKVISVFESTIAYSSHTTYQVLVKSIPLKQMMRNKIEALKSRKEIRDAFDIEFLIRRGIKLQLLQGETTELLSIIDAFTRQDFNVKLSSILPLEMRQYYQKNQFNFLKQQLEFSCSKRT
jgi:hypothetical protein